MSKKKTSIQVVCSFLNVSLLIASLKMPYCQARMSRNKVFKASLLSWFCSSSPLLIFQKPYPPLPFSLGHCVA